MKKYIALVLCLIMIISLISCDSMRDDAQASSVSTVATESPEGDNDTPAEKSNAEIAMEMYAAAIKGEISVFDDRLGEIKLADCRFVSDDSCVKDHEILNKVVIDLDSDGIKEYVIRSADEKDHIVLHYYDGRVYSYGFGVKDFYNLNADGSFYWNDDSVYGLSHCGLNRLRFDGATPIIEEIYRVKESETFDEYHLGGKQVTRDEFLDYYNDRFLAKARFTPFEMSREYPISAELAVQIASDYWGIKGGEMEGTCGATILTRIALLDKPSENALYYRVAWQYTYSSHIYLGWESRPPHEIKPYKEVIIDAFTGQRRALTQREALEIAKKGCNAEENGYELILLDKNGQDHDVYIFLVRTAPLENITEIGVNKFNGRVVDVELG